MRSLAPLCLLSVACATSSPPPAVAPGAATSSYSRPEETHFTSLQRLTDGGENAEAYWSFDGQRASMQRRSGDALCDRIYTLSLFQNGQPVANPQPVQVSSGKGATTCSYFFPEGQDLLYASTHLGGDACPPRPDMSQGYVWALYDSYDIFKAKADGSGVQRLTETPGYDAEGTVCGRDGSIIFTSVRDGDIDLYRMNRDGSNVQRLTSEPGYDGGAFFNADCSKIVWRASRPKPGKELDEFKSLLSRGLVRPTKLELFVANADGSDPRQVTYLDAATFAPFWFPNRDRIIFASNYGDPKGREFEIWAINLDGTQLERITNSPGFDGFPMFSPDGKWLLFSSNRGNPPESHDTNVFLSAWNDHPPQNLVAGAPERIATDVAWLADPAREGRGVGTQGLAASGEWLESRVKALGLEPLGDAGTYRSAFQVATAVKRGAATKLRVAGKDLAAEQFTPLGWSAQGKASGVAILAGHGLQDSQLGLDDFKGLDVRGKIVVARRFVPDSDKLTSAESQRRAGDLRKKAFVARSLGAKALVVVDWPAPPKKAAAAPAKGPAAAASPTGPGTAPPPSAAAAAAQTPSGTAQLPSTGAPAPAAPSPAGAPAAAGGSPHATGADPHAAMSGGSSPDALPTEAPLPELRTEGSGDAGIPVLVTTRAALEPVWKKLTSKQAVPVELEVALEVERAPAFNVVGRIPAKNKTSQASVIIGAHYDHLGYGGPDSLAPDKHVPHLGADDNGSGTATLLEIARNLTEQRDQLSHDVIIAFFSGEESGVLGSSALVASKPAWLGSAIAMLNLDMVGRLRGNTLQVLGSDSAREWPDIVSRVCETERVSCKVGGDGYGPSDHMPFYTAGLPVLHFFTGAHSDYHKPSDTAALLNDGGMAQVAKIVSEVARTTQTLTFQKSATPQGRGDARSFNASLGTVPDYGGPPPGTKGVLLSDVRPGGGAALAGMKRGDILIKLGKFDIGSVEDLMFVLMQAKPGETVTGVVLREGKPLSVETTFQEGRRR
ncbi:MAG TPA: M20/M25/M40 family metallo-hydrolase [Polyangiales bacterium]|nr:M20/M25/M40 family metallo-hydrolase [Polyangiales bacterium]